MCRLSAPLASSHYLCKCQRVLTELWAELRKSVWHELSGLMPTHDVSDLLSALLRASTMKGRQSVLAYDITFRHKVIVGSLVCPVDAAWLPQYGGGRQLGCPVVAAPALAEVTAAGQVVEDNAVQSSSRQSPFLQPDAGLFSFAAGSSPQRACCCATRPLQPATPSASVPPRQRLLFLPECGVSLGVLAVVVRQLRPSYFSLGREAESTTAREREREKERGRHKNTF